MPAITFHESNGLELGLNLLIISPDNKNPSTMPINDIGPANNHEETRYIRNIVSKGQLIRDELFQKNDT